jgi:hypothetical protein
MDAICRTVATENPLLQWSPPFTGRPDHNYARQFSKVAVRESSEHLPALKPARKGCWEWAVLRTTVRIERTREVGG